MINNSKKYLYFFIVLSSLIASFVFINFTFERSLVQYSDWLINYQGGFVRRGLIGEFFYQIYQFSNIPLDMIILFFVCLFYIFFAFLLIRLLKLIKFDLLNFLIIFSPLSFLYPAMEQKVSGRKEIMFFLTILILTLFLEKLKFKNQKYLIIFLSLITTFSHSGFFVYLPFFILIFVVVNYREKFKNLFREIIFITSSFFVLFAIVMFNTSIDKSNIVLMCNSLIEFQPRCGNTDYIETLSWSFGTEIKEVKKIINKDHYIAFYSIAYVLFNLPLGYAFFNSKIIKKEYSKINLFFVFVFINILTLPLYYVGGDYGRYMHISYLSLLIVYFKAVSIKFIKPAKLNFNLKRNQMILIIFLFGFVFTVPHCCNNNFKFVYSKPLNKIISLYND